MNRGLRPARLRGMAALNFLAKSKIYFWRSCFLVELFFGGTVFWWNCFLVELFFGGAWDKA
jgi:hypothetical protein